MKMIYDYLASVGLIKPEKATENILRKFNNNKLEEIIYYISNLLTLSSTSSDYRSDTSFFSFTSNSILSGAPFPCAEYKCRIENVDRLARFAALYSDKVYIQSPFDSYLHQDIVNRERFLGDIFILIKLRPLIESNIIDFSGRTLSLCPVCLKKIINIEDEFDNQLNILMDMLNDDLLEKVNFKIVWEGEPVIHIDGVEDYGFHEDFVVRFKKVPPIIDNITSKDHDVILSKAFVKEAGIMSILLDPVIDDLILQNALTSVDHSTYLTDRSIDATLLSALYNEEERLCSSNIVKSLSHLLPTIENVDLKNIVKLRIEDGESFKVYRDAVTSVLNNVSKENEYTLKQAFRDIIQPELNNIDLTIKNTKRTLLHSCQSDLAFTAGALSIGLYGGFIPLDIGQILAAISGLTFFRELYSKTISSLRTPDSVKNNKYYFLWKLQR